MKYRVLRMMDCAANELTTFEGGPRTVGGNLWCERNKLVTLKGMPKVGKNIVCYGNMLTSLEGLDPEFKNVLDCTNNPLESLKGLPKELDELDIRFMLNPDGSPNVDENGFHIIRFTYKDIKKVCKVKGNVYIK